MLHYAFVVPCGAPCETCRGLGLGMFWCTAHHVLILVGFPEYLAEVSNTLKHHCLHEFLVWCASIELHLFQTPQPHPHPTHYCLLSPTLLSLSNHKITLKRGG